MVYGIGIIILIWFIFLLHVCCNVAGTITYMFKGHASHHLWRVSPTFSFMQGGIVNLPSGWPTWPERTTCEAWIHDLTTKHVCFVLLRIGRHHIVDVQPFWIHLVLINLVMDPKKPENHCRRAVPTKVLQVCATCSTSKDPASSKHRIHNSYRSKTSFY